MAKVIQKGVVQYTHKACKSVIEFHLDELKEDSISDYLGDREYFRSLTCPSCGGVIRFLQYGDID